MKISIGNDHGGCNLAKFLVEELKNDGFDIVYYGSFPDDGPVDYPDFAKKVANDIKLLNSDFGILVCRTGIGMCISANRIGGVRAAVCYSEQIAKLARQHNNANIACFGADMTDEKLALLIARTFLHTNFLGGRHQERINKIDTISTQYDQ